MGVCHALKFERFPAALHRSVVYVALTDGRGTVPMSVRLVDAGDEDAQPLFAFEFKAEFRSPLDVREVAVTPPPTLSIPRAGLYRWQVLCAAEVIGERRLVAEGPGGG